MQPMSGPLMHLPVPWDPAMARQLIAQMNAERYPAMYPAEVTAQAKADHPFMDDTLLRRQYLAPGILGGYAHGVPGGNTSVGVHDAAFANPQGSDRLRALRATFGLY